MKRLIVITGPTVSGKSALAIDLAKKLHTEIISADSRQIYHGIPIVTALPSAEELAAVPHHLIDMLPLDAYYSASMFEKDALEIAEKVWNNNDDVIVCGGSMMYVDALCNGIDDIPTVPKDIRERTIAESNELGKDWLIGELRKLDPEYIEKADLKNTKRLIHALEIIRTSGKKYSSFLTGRKRERPFSVVKLLLEVPREILFERINSRVERMFDTGLLDEAERVYPRRHLNSLNTVGLKELFQYFDGILDLPTARERIKKNTRVYAKKQMTWFRRDEDVIRFDITDSGFPGNIVSYLADRRQKS